MAARHTRKRSAAVVALGTMMMGVVGASTASADSHGDIDIYDFWLVNATSLNQVASEGDQICARYTLDNTNDEDAVTIRPSDFDPSIPFEEMLDPSFAEITEGDGYTIAAGASNVAIRGCFTVTAAQAAEPELSLTVTAFGHESTDTMPTSSATLSVDVDYYAVHYDVTGTGEVNIGDWFFPRGEVVNTGNSTAEGSATSDITVFDSLDIPAGETQRIEWNLPQEVAHYEDGGEVADTLTATLPNLFNIGTNDIITESDSFSLGVEPAIGGLLSGAQFFIMPDTDSGFSSIHTYQQGETYEGYIVLEKSAGVDPADVDLELSTTSSSSPEHIVVGDFVEYDNSYGATISYTVRGADLDNGHVFVGYTLKDGDELVAAHGTYFETQWVPGSVDDSSDATEPPTAPTTPTPTPPVTPEPTPGYTPKAEDMTAENFGGVVTPRDLVRGEEFSMAVDSKIATPGDEIDVWMFSDPVLLAGEVTVADGNAAFTVTLPADTSLGEHRIAVYSTDGELLGWEIVNVLSADGSGGGDSLAETGASAAIALLIVAALAMTLVGGNMLFASRRFASNLA